LRGRGADEERKAALARLVPVTMPGIAFSEHLKDDGPDRLPVNPAEYNRAPWRADRYFLKNLVYPPVA
jgi:hypothetical protein